MNITKNNNECARGPVQSLVTSGPAVSYVGFFFYKVVQVILERVKTL